MKVIALAVQGLSKTAVAHRMGIKKNVLSNWISRFDDVRNAFVPPAAAKEHARERVASAPRV